MAFQAFSNPVSKTHERKSIASRSSSLQDIDWGYTEHCKYLDRHPDYKKDEGDILIIVVGQLPEEPGPALTRAGPYLKHFAGPHSVVCRHFWGWAWRNDRNWWCYKARSERLTPRPLQQRLQCTAPLNPINQIITTLINTSSLVRHLLDQKGVTITNVVPPGRIGIACCASGYPELKSLQW